LKLGSPSELYTIILILRHPCGCVWLWVEKVKGHRGRARKWVCVGCALWLSVWLYHWTKNRQCTQYFNVNVIFMSNADDVRRHLLLELSDCCGTVEALDLREFNCTEW